MTWSVALANLTINLFAGFLIFLLGLFWPVIPKSYKKYLLKKFWGSAVLTDDIIITYGALIDIRMVQTSPPKFRYFKQYHDGKQIQLAGPSGSIVGECEVRSFSYLINTLSDYRKSPISVVSDKDAFPQLNRTIIALGSPSSNELSDFIMREEKNTYFHFKQVNDDLYIEEKTSKQQFRGFRAPTKKDYGIIIKIRNSRFPKHYLFVCAGLGEWGTSGAAWYLANKWSKLIATDEFGLVVEVDIGLDESAKRVFPINGI